MKKIGVIVMALFIFSCNTGESEKILREANGSINYLMIVMKNSEWQTELGDELRKIIAEPVLGLPQPEAQFEVSQVPPESFGSMFKATRSVLRIGIGEKKSFTVNTDVYASPQKIVTLTGTSKEELAELIRNNGKKIVKIFKDADILSVQKKVISKFWDPTKVKTFTNHGYSLRIPVTYNKVEDDGDFLWYRFHLAGGNSMELISYTLPILSDDDENGNNIVAARETIGKKYIPGQIEGSYMITEEAYTPHIFEIEMEGNKAFETRGKWEVKDMYMAGPFLSYSVVDKPNNRIVVVEGFTYAPSIKKRDYMFELEAILKTLKIG